MLCRSQVDLDVGEVHEEDRRRIPNGDCHIKPSYGSTRRCNQAKAIRQLGDAVSATHSRWPSPALNPRWHEVWWTYEPTPKVRLNSLLAAIRAIVTLSFVTAFGETNQTLLYCTSSVGCSVRSKKARAAGAARTLL